MSRSQKNSKKMVITVEQRRAMLVHRAGKPLTPVGGAIRPEKGGGYNRARDKHRARRDDD